MGFIKTFIGRGIRKEAWAEVSHAPGSPVLRMRKSPNEGRKGEVVKELHWPFLQLEGSRKFSDPRKPMITG